MKDFIINDRCLFPGGTGVGLYLKNLLENWPPESGLAPRGFCSHILNKRPPGDRVPGDKPGVALRPLAGLSRSAPAANRLSAIAKGGLQRVYNAMFRRACRRGRFTGYFEPNYIAIRSDLPTVTTVHDLSVLEYPQWHPADRVARWQRQFAASMKVTGHWIADSEFTRRRIVAILGIAEKDVTFIPLAARPLPYPTCDELPSLLEAAGLPSQYMLHLGTLEPRKNLRILLDAYRSLPASQRQRCPLILAGSPGWGDVEFWRSLAEHPVASEVLTTGYVSDAAAALLLAGATAVLVPSHYEGFGLPILEGMACGTPVICSTAGAFREIAEGAAALVDPGDAEGWGAAILRAMDAPSWRSEMAAAGAQRAGRYSWQETASRHAALFSRQFI